MWLCGLVGESSWGDWGDMQQLPQRLAELLMSHIQRMLEERPAESCELRLHRISPAFVAEV